MAIKSSLSILKTEQVSLAETLIDSEIASKFSFGIYNIEVRDLDGFLKEVETRYGDQIIISKFAFSKKGMTTYYIEGVESGRYDPFFLIMSSYKKNSAVAEIYTKSHSAGATFFDRFKDWFVRDEEIAVYLENFYYENGLRSEIMPLKLDDLEGVSAAYYPDITDVNKFFDQFFKSKENILILEGPSGIGKSKFASMALKWMLKHLESIPVSKGEYDTDADSFINVGYVKNEEILASDSFWVSLRQKDYALVVLDDLDNFLFPRSQGGGSDLEIMANRFVSQLLSYTDGLVPTRTKFIITTNVTIDAIDSALLREGRLFYALRFSKLSNKEAKAIWVDSGLDKDEFQKHFSEKEVLQGALGSKIHEYKKNNNRSFGGWLKEGSDADVSKKYLTGRKAGII